MTISPPLLDPIGPLPQDFGFLEKPSGMETQPLVPQQNNNGNQVNTSLRAKSETPSPIRDSPGEQRSTTSSEDENVKAKSSQDYTYQDICKYFNIKLEDACKEIGLSSTSMKKLCRKFHIRRWPYRKYRSLVTKKEKLQSQYQNQNSLYHRLRIQEKLQKINQELEAILDPNTYLSNAIKPGELKKKKPPTDTSQQPALYQQKPMPHLQQQMPPQYHFHETPVPNSVSPNIFKYQMGIPGGPILGHKSPNDHLLLGGYPMMQQPFVMSAQPSASTGLSPALADMMRPQQSQKQPTGQKQPIKYSLDKSALQTADLPMSLRSTNQTDLEKKTVEQQQLLEQQSKVLQQQSLLLQQQTALLQQKYAQPLHQEVQQTMNSFALHNPMYGAKQPFFFDTNPNSLLLQQQTVPQPQTTPNPTMTMTPGQKEPTNGPPKKVEESSVEQQPKSSS